MPRSRDLSIDPLSHAPPPLSKQQKAEELMPLLSHPQCHIYVCGDSNMAGGLSASLSDVLGRESMNKLVGEGRMHEEVFGVQLNVQVWHRSSL